MLADLDSLEKRVDNLAKKARGQDKEAIAQLDLVKRAIDALSNGKPARVVVRKDEEEAAFQSLQLITAKPVLYVCNVEESAAATGNALSAKLKRGKSENVSRSRSRQINQIAMLPIGSAKVPGSRGQAKPGCRLIRRGLRLARGW
jgi:ribosome-binding ATPase YchF (GTP1/OBG family)